MNRNRVRLRGTLMLLATDERGQDLVEYALIAAVIGFGAIASLKGLSTSIGTFCTHVGTTLTSSL